MLKNLPRAASRRRKNWRRIAGFMTARRRASRNCLTPVEKMTAARLTGLLHCQWRIQGVWDAAPTDPDIKCDSSQKPNSRILFSFSSNALKLTFGIEKFKKCPRVIRLNLTSQNGRGEQRRIQRDVCAPANPGVKYAIYHSNILHKSINGLLDYNFDTVRLLTKL